MCSSFKEYLILHQIFLFYNFLGFSAVFSSLTCWIGKVLSYRDSTSVSNSFSVRPFLLQNITRFNSSGARLWCVANKADLFGDPWNKKPLLSILGGSIQLFYKHLNFSWTGSFSKFVSKVAKRRDWREQCLIFRVGCSQSKLKRDLK